MSAVPSTHETQELRRLIPLNTLPQNRFEQLCSELRLESAGKGSILFRQGDATTEFVYLLSGTVSLQAGGVEMDAVTGGSDVSRFALAHQNPRKVSAIAKTQVRYVRINPEAVSQREVVQRAAAAYEVSDGEEPSEGDWMSALLRSPVFQRLPPANLQALLRSIDEIEVKAGQVICHQDDPGDYFYIIKSGQCALTRKATPAAKEIRLASLKACDTFGEDALISERPRTLTVTMDTDGHLLRLDKANFLKLVRDPIISRLNAQDAVEMVRQGGIWLDVRLPDHYQQSHPRGNIINAPFFSLRMMVATFDRHKKYICVCEDGKLSDAAAYLLLRHRFNVYVLKGGLPSLSNDELISVAASATAAGEFKSPRGEPDAKLDFGTVESETGKPERKALANDASVGEDIRGRRAQLETAGADRELAARSEHDLRGLEARLSRLLDEKETSETEIQNARQTIHQLSTSLNALQREHERLLQAQDKREGPEQADQLGDDRQRQELEDLKTRNAELAFEKESADQEISSLEKQVDDLKAMVQEFLEQGELPVDEEVEALRAELQMVREHAGSELTTLQALLGEAEAENNRLRSELQSIKTKISIREVAESVEQEVQDDAPRFQSANIVLPLALGFLLAAIVLGSLFGLAPGRDLLRSWLIDVPPPQSTSG